MNELGRLFGERSEGATLGQGRPDQKPAVYKKSGRPDEARVWTKVVRGQAGPPGAAPTTGYSKAGRPAKARGVSASEPLSGNRQGAKDGAAGRTGQREVLLESYLRGLTDHRNALGEYLVELEREREELERERGDLALKIEANEEKREKVSSYIEDLPRLRDTALRSLVRGMEEPEDG